MNRRRSIVTITVALTAVLFMAAAGSAMAASVTSASGDQTTNGSTATVSVQASDAGSVTLSGIPNSWSVDSSTNDGSFLSPDGPNGNQISSQGTVLWVWNTDQSSVSVDVTLSVPSGAAIQTNTLDVTVENSTGASDTTTVDVTVQQPQQTGTITVNTGSSGDSVEAVNSNTGATEASGTTGASGQVALTVPANTNVDIVVNGATERSGVSVSTGGNTNINVGGGTTPPPTGTGGLQDPVDASGNRIVQNGSTVFLGEDDIATDKGVFANVQPGQFTDQDDAVFSLTNGVVDEDNAISTYTIDTDGDGVADRTFDVREARIQSLFVIDALSNQRLDTAETPEVEQPGPNADFNVQFAVDYNYFQSTSIDTTTDLLTQDGSDVTDIYLEGSRDISLEAPPAGLDGFKSVDERQRVYDALFNFSIDDTGEYTFTAEPRSGDDRADGRDVGFDEREDATDTEVVKIIDDEDVEVELSSDTANQGDRVDFSIVGLLEGEIAAATIEAEDLRFNDFGNFGELVSTFNQNPGTKIADKNPIDFASGAFRQADEIVNTGLIFSAQDFTAEGVAPIGDRLGLENAGVDERDLVVFDTSDLDSVRVYRVDGQGPGSAPVDITSQIGGPLNLKANQPGLDRFAAAVSGTPTLQLERVYGIIQRDEGEAAGQVDTERLDDTSVDVEVFGNVGTKDGEGIIASNPANLSQTLVGVFRGEQAFRDNDDEQTIDVSPVQITVDKPGETYVPGVEVDVSGSITGSADDVVVFVRDQDNYFHVLTETTDRASGSYDETGFDLSNDAATDQARDILSQPGVYRYGVIDGVDIDIIQAINPGRKILGDDGLDEAQFNQGSSTQTSLRVVEPSLKANYRTFDGSIFEDDGLDLRGTLVGPREYLTFLTDDRGNSQIQQFTADEDDGEIEEDDISLSGLTEGTIQASVLSPGRDTQFGDGSFRIPGVGNDQAQLEDATLNSFTEFARRLSETSRTQSQVREILLDQTVRQSGSDDLIVSEEFRLSDDSRTSINDIVPQSLANNLTGINPIEVGETMVVRGTTNRNPDDATIVVEAEQGPSTAELGTAVADEWPADGEENAQAPGGVWSAQLQVGENVEPGEYIIRADDGDRIDEATVEIVSEGTIQDDPDGRLTDQTAQLRQQIQELEGQIQSLEQERNQLEQNVTNLQQQNSELQSQLEAARERANETQQPQNGTTTNETDTGGGQGQPGFTAVAALVALIAVALLALRRREEE